MPPVPSVRGWLLRRFQQEMLHHVSLLYVLAMKHLRKDFNLDDIYAHNIGGAPPCLVRGGRHAAWTHASARMLAWAA